MALARTNLLSVCSGGTYGTGSYTTTSFTPDNNSLLVVIVAVVESSGSTDPSGDITLDDSADLTWTTRQTLGDGNSWSRGVKVFTAPVTTGASMTLTADCGTRNIDAYSIEAFCYTAYDTGSPIGATASKTSTVTDGAESITLSGAPASSSEVLAWIYTNAVDYINGSAVTPGTGWSEIYDQSALYGSVNLQSQIRAGSTSTTVAWNDVSVDTDGLWYGIAGAIEVKEAAAGGGVAAAIFINANQFA